MTDRGIIFSAPMVLALLAGRKTQTRRLSTSPLRRCQIGDRLWVRETFRHWKGSASQKTACYVADGTWIDHGSGWTGKPEVTWGGRATPSIHMPRWASRLTLIVTDVRVQPLQAISAADAIAEGVHPSEKSPAYFEVGDFVGLDPVALFASLWGSLHDQPGQRWEDNPDLVALTFDVRPGNIDRLEP